MGKSDFKSIVKQALARNGSASLKISSFCDDYDERKNYAGMIVYSVEGKYKWKNEAGYCKGYNGRFGYVVLKCTDNWPPHALREAGGGRVHHYLLKKALGYDFNQGKVCCGGFAVLKGEMRSSSVWLNSNHQTGGQSDGSKYLSRHETSVVDAVLRQWKAGKKNYVMDFPMEVLADMSVQKPHRVSSNRSQPSDPDPRVLLARLLLQSARALYSLSLPDQDS
jgi:hypothetical protein